MEKHTANFSDEELKFLSKKFKIISEMSRLKILRAISGGEKCVTDIIKETGLLQANVSKQLKMMQKDAIVSCRPSGLQRFYSIADKNIMKVCVQICGEMK